MGNSKITLLLLHGALGSKDSFNHLIPHLELNYNLIIPDLPSHGGNTSSKDPYSVEYLSDFLYEYLLPFSAQDIFVFGYSLGGYLALFHEFRFPGSFVKVITMATKFDWTPGFAEIQEKGLSPVALKANLPAYYESLCNMHKGDVDHLLLKISCLMKRLGDVPLVNPELIRAISIPLLLSVGDRDKMVSIEETKHLTSCGNHVSFSLLENTVHPIEKLKPETLNSLLEFFDS